MNKQAKDFSGHDIGRGHILMPFWEGANRTQRWCEITMITHKKNGNVRIRTSNGEREFAAEDMVELLG